MRQRTSSTPVIPVGEHRLPSRRFHSEEPPQHNPTSNPCPVELCRSSLDSLDLARDPRRRILHYSPANPALQTSIDFTRSKSLDQTKRELASSRLPPSKSVNLFSRLMFPKLSKSKNTARKRSTARNENPLGIGSPYNVEWVRGGDSRPPVVASKMKVQEGVFRDSRSWRKIVPHPSKTFVSSPKRSPTVDSPKPPPPLSSPTKSVHLDEAIGKGRGKASKRNIERILPKTPEHQPSISELDHYYMELGLKNFRFPQDLDGNVAGARSDQGVGTGGGFSNAPSDIDLEPVQPLSLKKKVPAKTESWDSNEDKDDESSKSKKTTVTSPELAQRLDCILRTAPARLAIVTTRKVTSPDGSERTEVEVSPALFYTPNSTSSSFTPASPFSPVSSRPLLKDVVQDTPSETEEIDTSPVSPPAYLPKNKPPRLKNRSRPPPLEVSRWSVTTPSVSAPSNFLQFSESEAADSFCNDFHGNEFEDSTSTVPSLTRTNGQDAESGTRFIRSPTGTSIPHKENKAGGLYVVNPDSIPPRSPASDTIEPKPKRPDSRPKPIYFPQERTEKPHRLTQSIPNYGGLHLHKPAFSQVDNLRRAKTCDPSVIPQRGVLNTRPVLKTSASSSPKSNLRGISAEDGFPQSEPNRFSPSQIRPRLNSASTPSAGTRGFSLRRRKTAGGTVNQESNVSGMAKNGINEKLRI